MVAEPRFGCEEGRFTARGGPTGSLDMSVAALLRSDTGITTFSGKGLKVAGTSASFDGRLDDKGWQVKAVTGQALVSELRKFAAPWFELPKDITGDGKVAIEGTLADAGAGLSADVTAKLSAVDLTNEASTIVTDKLVGGGTAARRTSRPGHATAGEIQGHRGPAAGRTCLPGLRQESDRPRGAGKSARRHFVAGFVAPAAEGSAGRQWQRHA